MQVERPSRGGTPTTEKIVGFNTISENLKLKTSDK